MTKKELIASMEEYDEDSVVVVSDGKGWANIEDVKRDGSSIAIVHELFPVFSDN